MEAFAPVEGAAAPLMRANIDTDIIIRIERLTSGAELGRYAFEALRYREDGAENPDFVLNQDGYRGAPVLISGANFGCGSSREGAVTAIAALGVRAIIAESFGDIFYANCFQNGVLPIRLPASRVAQLAARAAPGARFRVDLARQVITDPTGAEDRFEIAALRRLALLEGLDDIALSLRAGEAIAAWQAHDRAARPWVWDIPKDLNDSMDSRA